MTPVNNTEWDYLLNYSPEQKLLWALLSTAMADLLSQQELVARRARMWILEKGDGVDDSLTFDYCCEHLRLDSQTIREGIFRVIQNISRVNAAMIKVKLRSRRRK